MESSYRQSQLFLEIFLVVCGSFFRTVRILGNVVEFDDRPSAEIDFMQSFENGGGGHQALPPPPTTAGGVPLLCFLAALRVFSFVAQHTTTPLLYRVRWSA